MVVRHAPRAEANANKRRRSARHEPDLRMALYGLRQTPKNCNETIVQGLRSHGPVQCLHDTHAIFILLLRRRLYKTGPNSEIVAEVRSMPMCSNLRHCKPRGRIASSGHRGSTGQGAGLHPRLAEKVKETVLTCFRFPLGIVCLRVRVDVLVLSWTAYLQTLLINKSSSAVQSIIHFRVL